MKRLFLIVAAVAVLMGLAAPAVLAAGPARHDGPVLMAFNGDVTVPAGEQADAVFVANGTATINGQVGSVVVISGTATLEGATITNILVVDGTLTLGAGTTVSGDVRTIGATVNRDPAAVVSGTVRAADADLVAFAAALAPLIVLFILGFALVTIVAGLALAALAARQVRSAEALISREPAETFVFGLAGLVVIPLVAILCHGDHRRRPAWSGDPADGLARRCRRRLPRRWDLDRRMAALPWRDAATRATVPGLRGRVGRTPVGHDRPVRRLDRQPARVRGSPAPRVADLPPARASPDREPAHDPTARGLKRSSSASSVGLPHGRADRSVLAATR